MRVYMCIKAPVDRSNPSVIAHSTTRCASDNELSHEHMNLLCPKRNQTGFAGRLLLLALADRKYSRYALVPVLLLMAVLWPLFVRHSCSCRLWVSQPHPRGRGIARSENCFCTDREETWLGPHTGPAANTLRKGAIGYVFIAITCGYMSTTITSVGNPT